jgi:hypothetical protein
MVGAGLRPAPTVVTLLVGCAVADRWSGVSQARQLHAIGEPARAEIVRIWDTGMTVNNDPVIGFVLQVTPDTRPAYEAQTKLRISRIQVSQFQPGAVVPVRIDPKNPERVSLDIYEFEK